MGSTGHVTHLSMQLKGDLFVYSTVWRNLSVVVPLICIETSIPSINMAGKKEKKITCTTI